MSEKMREALQDIVDTGFVGGPQLKRALIALAEQPAQGDAVAFLANGARFKLAALPRSAAFMSFPSELAGKWVALVDATDDRHLLLKAPPAPSVPDDVAKDAARYRFIRSAACQLHCIYFTSFGERFNLAGEDLDHSIDAAMLAEAEPRS